VIPITKVDVRDSEDLVVQVIRSGSLAQGVMVERLENEFARSLGVENCVAVNNGTTALVAALQVCDLQEGDEVITSPFTFVATLNAILEAGGRVRFADITREDFCVNPDSINNLVCGRTKVLMPVHLYGQCADMNSIMAISEKHDLKIVEDAAQAHGATFNNVSAGSFGIGCFSLYATKNVSCGEGGLITTNDNQIADRLRVLRNQGMRERYKYEVIGHNYRLTDIHAAVALPQISKMKAIAAQRSLNAAKLSMGLAHLSNLRLPGELSGRGHVWHQYTIVLGPASPVERDEFIAKMYEEGVACGAYYPKLVFDHDCFRNDSRVIVDAVPVASEITKSCVSLPVHQHLTEQELEKIIESVTKILS
jgi:perosamine synthetase